MSTAAQYIKAVWSGPCWDPGTVAKQMTDAVLSAVYPLLWDGREEKRRTKTDVH